MTENVSYLKEKGVYLKELRDNESRLFEVLNANNDNATFVYEFYKPIDEFKPVKMLRFLVANELIKGNQISNTELVAIKNAIEARDVSAYYDLNEIVLNSLTGYKKSKVGMFPNWSENFKILFPFIYSEEENTYVKKALEELTNDVISKNNLTDVQVHIVTFQGSQNYGGERAWTAIIPKSAPNVQRAFQLFFAVDYLGLESGIHKGARLLKSTDLPKKELLTSWEEHIDQTKSYLEKWKSLNADIDFTFQKDERVFKSYVEQMSKQSIGLFFGALDRLQEDLLLEDSDNLVFSTGSKQLSFQVGKRFCLNIKKSLFDFITSSDYKIEQLSIETFSEPSNAYLYLKANESLIKQHYKAIKEAVDKEIERDSHTNAKNYDNAAFRKAVFDTNYRAQFLKTIVLEVNEPNYHLVGAFWEGHTPEDMTNHFLSNGIWQNGYDNKFIDEVKNVAEGDLIAIKSTFTRNKTTTVMSIKARGQVVENVKDGKNLKVNWEEDFIPFEVDFSGGYWSTIKQVKNQDHINAIWSSNEGMENVKEKFIDWYIQNSTSNYFKNDGDKIDAYLQKKSGHFSSNIFEVNAETYLKMINFIEETINKNKSIFLKNHGAVDSGKLAAIVGKNNYQKFLLEYFENDQNDSSRHQDFNKKSKVPINQILYGPPGTGKTYRLQNEYFENYTVREAKITKERYLEAIVSELTWWQSLAVAIFELGQASINEIKNHEIILAKQRLSSAKSINPIIWSQLQAHCIFGCPNVNVALRSDPQIFYKEADSSWRLEKEALDELYPEAKEISKKIHNFNPQNSKAIRNYEFVTFHQSFSYEDFVEGIKPKMEEGQTDLEYQIEDGVFKKLCTRAKLDPENNYAIFIDEINRGNVSAIFGELITLIEKDKRAGAINALEVQLPYSKGTFSVPDNIHIYGTMNTADRSVEALDTALRRRFTFKELMPDSSLLKDKKFEDFTLKEVLDTINERIEVLVDRDHTIGHSYFLTVDSGDTEALTLVFQDKIIPLLQEYFYHDYAKIALILGSGFVQENNNNKVQFASFQNIEVPSIETQFILINEIEDIEKAVHTLLNRTADIKQL